ncbi:MAG: amino acid permease [Spirosomataceae bacterium]
MKKLKFSNETLFRRKSAEAIVRDSDQVKLEKKLTVKDLTVFGVAALIGTGIFATIGLAAYSGGPGVSLLFIFTAVACAFTGLAYAEFASMVPVAGSSYTYSYVAFGELPAWCIGWAMVLEYSIGNISVAISFSDYFSTLFYQITDVSLPAWITTNYVTASGSYEVIQSQLNAGKTWDTVSQLPEFANRLEGFLAWKTAPQVSGFRIIADVPALLATLGMMALVYRGIRESSWVGAVLVVIKVTVLLLVVSVGAFFIHPDHWQPFLPHGASGVLMGVSAVFYAYIGFDAIATVSEECINPRRDVPKAIFYSLAISTVLYVLVALVITGMVNYRELNVGDPLAYVFGKFPQMRWLTGVVSFGGVMAIASILLVYLIGQPRIWMSMSRDGLMPPIFGRIHPRFHTPAFATLVSGALVAVPTLFLDMNAVVDAGSISTLFAFVLVCGGILRLRNSPAYLQRSFQLRYISGRWIVFGLLGLSLYFKGAAYWLSAPWITGAQWPELLFWVVFVFLAIQSYRLRLSLIPTLGLLTCLYMMAQMGWKNWFWFGIWQLAGLVIYLTYGYRHSQLSTDA